MGLSDDIVYATILISSVPAGLIIRKLEAGIKRQSTVGFLGFLLVATFCQSLLWHSFLTVVVNCIIIQFISARHIHKLSFLWNFGYLAFFRTTPYFAIAPISPLSNAIQLILTLKITGLAFELRDSADQKADGSAQKSHLFVSKPSMFDVFCYSYSYIGLFTGPIYTYRTFKDMVNDEQSHKVAVGASIKSRLKLAPLAAVTFLVTSHFFKLDYVKSAAFSSEPFWFRLFYMVPMFMVFRTRFYVAWLLAECMCMTATLGAYPAASKPRCLTGPTDVAALEEERKKPRESVEMSFKTIENIDIYGCELAPTVRDGLRAWNTTVQAWLASNVYRRVGLRAYRVTITMAVSAWWHGIHPGYYLSFLTVPLCVEAEERVRRLFSNSGNTRICDAVNWFFKMRAFDYMCMGFILLRFDFTIRYWSSIYFALHVLLGIILAISFVFRPPESEVKSK